MFPKKEQNKTTEGGLREVDIGRQPKKEFRLGDQFQRRYGKNEESAAVCLRASE